MKLIDADLLEKEIYKWMPKDQETWMESDLPPIENLVVSIMMTIQEQPTVDAVPVIRCKDCKHHYYHEMLKQDYCEIPNMQFGEIEPNGYCHRAERKDE